MFYSLHNCIGPTRIEERNEIDPTTERIMLVQALPEEAVRRFLSAEGACAQAGLTRRLERLYREPTESEPAEPRHG